ncbi:hypothetical protein COCC4DRAFT_29887, partial [Bipolaris maydis ATCC 48331]
MVRAKKTFAFVTVSSTLIIHTVPTARTTRRGRSGEEAPSPVTLPWGLLAAY